MPDCSDLKNKYDKAKDKADRMRDKADAARDRYEDAEDNYDFESGTDCSLHTITLPDGTPVPDTQDLVDCIQERERAKNHYRDKMDKAESRMKDAEDAAENAEGEADEAQTEWCACEEGNRGDGDDPEPEFDLDDYPASEPGDWNEPDWTGYAVG